ATAEVGRDAWRRVAVAGPVEGRVVRRLAGGDTKPHFACTQGLRLTGIIADGSRACGARTGPCTNCGRTAGSGARTGTKSRRTLGGSGCVVAISRGVLP